MKKNVYLLTIIFLLFSTKAKSQQAYQVGEELSFKLYYNSVMTGNVTAGEVTTSVNWVVSELQPNENIHISLKGKTLGAFRWFFKAEDSYDTYVKKANNLPYCFRQRLHEGDYTANNDFFFNQNKGNVKTVNLKNNDVRNYNLDCKVQDLLSSLYYIRNWDFSNVTNNQAFNFNLFMSDSIYNIEFRFKGYETIKTSFGKVNCMKFAPKVITGSVFADETPMMVYVSNDENHVPILAESELMVGKAKMELVDYKGLKYPLKIIN